MVAKWYLFLGIFWASHVGLGQHPYELFDQVNNRFDSTLYGEYSLLRATVKVGGEIDWESHLQEKNVELIPSLLYGESYKITERRKNVLKGFLSYRDRFNVCGSIDSSVSQNSKGTQAKYFVIHDTSFPNYLEEDFPDNINDATWIYNDLERFFGVENGRKPLAHAFINRKGKILCQLDFSVPWRATKLELKKIDESISKGLFLHVELVQPRKSDSTKWKGNDLLAPSSGFTGYQYQSLGMLYIVASVRAGRWLIPTFHAVLDNGIKDAHDDPQRFSFRKFERQVHFYLQRMDGSYNKAQHFGYFEPEDSLIEKSIDLWATWYYVPTYRSVEDGIPILDQDAQPTGYALDSCEWCDAVIEGTVLVQTDTNEIVFNYAGRSDSIQFDCRACPGLSKYSGYEKSGKVLFMESFEYGLGVNNYNLVPFRTIATDPDVIPHGTVIYIPDAVGTKIIHRGITYSHDGYFFAGDAGSAIKGNHIDVFIGKATENPFDFVKSTSKGKFKAYILKEGSFTSLKGLHEV